jgi:uncharacterized protein (DUF1684 family)
MKHWFTQTAYRQAYSSGSTLGGWGSSRAGKWTTASTAWTAILGRVALAGQGETFKREKDTFVASHKLYCSATETLAITDRIVYSGSTYTVLGIKNTLGLNHHKVVYLREPK